MRLLVEILASDFMLDMAALRLHFMLFEAEPGRINSDAMEIHVWQSQIEIEYYSVAYFELITEFDAL